MNRSRPERAEYIVLSLTSLGDDSTVIEPFWQGAFANAPCAESESAFQPSKFKLTHHRKIADWIGAVVRDTDKMRIQPAYWQEI